MTRLCQKMNVNEENQAVWKILVRKFLLFRNDNQFYSGSYFLAQLEKQFEVLKEQLYRERLK